MKPEDFLNEVDMLLALDIDVVVDHFARVFCDRELAPLMERSVLKLLASGHGWLKLSGAYMAVPSGSHDLGELDNFVAAVKELHTSRLIWGTDWPHATEVEKPNDDATLANLLATWFPEATTRQSSKPRCQWSRHGHICCASLNEIQPGGHYTGGGELFQFSIWRLWCDNSYAARSITELR